MRRAVLVLACLLLSGVADAAQPDGLRGPLPAAAPTPAPKTTRIAPSIYTARPSMSFAGDSPLDRADGGQCRRACAQSYYFCLSTEGASDCPENWTSCVAACARDPQPLSTGGE